MASFNFNEKIGDGREKGSGRFAILGHKSGEGEITTACKACGESGSNERAEGNWLPVEDTMSIGPAERRGDFPGCLMDSHVPRTEKVEPLHY